MTTPIAHEMDASPAREKLPPVEHDRAVSPASAGAHLHEGGPSKPEVHVPLPTPSEQGVAPTERQVAMGKWLHKHRNATEGPVGYLGYQIVRNTLAAIPYGIATALTWVGFEKVAAAASKSNPESMIAKAARSPIRDVAMIATGFTFFRGTLKVVRFMKERLFDPKDSEAQSIKEVQDFGANLKDTLKEVSPAEVAATPVAAFALGYGRRFWDANKNIAPIAEQHFEAHKGVLSELAGELKDKAEKNLRKEAALHSKKYTVLGLFGKEFKAIKAFDPSHTRWQHIKNVMGTRKGNLAAEAAIVATSFIPFFELGDRRYKDAQVARGVWLNDPSSLVRKSDAEAKKELEEGQQYIDTVDQSGHTKHQDAVAQRAAESLHATGHLRPADKPTLTCFAFRRVVPTLLGISAYVAGKRLAYLGMGTMPEHYNPNKLVSSLGKMALVEGAATSLFWLNASVIDKMEPWYDKHFKDKPVPMTDPQIRRHMAELKDRLDAKEREKQGSHAVTVA